MNMIIAHLVILYKVSYRTIDYKSVYETKN